MIKLICPKCMKPVPVPDDFTGKEVTCPNCMKPFEVPARYTPAVLPDPPPARPEPPPPPPPVPAVVPVDVVPPTPPPIPPRPPEPPMSSDVPPAPPGFVPPVPPVPAAPAAYPAPPGYAPPPAGPAGPAVVPAPPGYTRAMGITISPRGVAWLPAVFLTVILALTFFDWIGSYVGGSAVYAQNAWRTISGRPYRNLPLEDVMKKETVWPPEVYDKTPSDWRLMVPYIIVLLLATAWAWNERFIDAPDRAGLPRRLKWAGGIWPHRVAVLTGLAVLMLVLLLAQAWMGFGLERSIRRSVSEKFAAEREKAGGSQAAQDAITFKEDQELARFNLERTTWLNLVIVLHVLVVLCLILRVVLARRGAKPPPQLVLHY